MDLRTLAPRLTAAVVDAVLAADVLQVAAAVVHRARLPDKAPRVDAHPLADIMLHAPVRAVVLLPVRLTNVREDAVEVASEPGPLRCRDCRQGEVRRQHVGEHRDDLTWHVALLETWTHLAAGGCHDALVSASATERPEDDGRPAGDHKVAEERGEIPLSRNGGGEVLHHVESLCPDASEEVLALQLLVECVVCRREYHVTFRVIHPAVRERHDMTALDQANEVKDTCVKV